MQIYSMFLNVSCFFLERGDCLPMTTTVPASISDSYAASEATATASSWISQKTALLLDNRLHRPLSTLLHIYGIMHQNTDNVAG